MKFSSFWLLISIWLLSGCLFEVPPEEDPRVDEMVNEKIAVKINEKRLQCREEVLLKAEYAVDSTLRVNALGEKLEVYNPPPKPLKPGKPIIPEIEDTFSIKPFEKNSNLPRDSLIKQ